ncbi:DUF4279 domain-containing protein [Pseudomarimonas arenosa]|uniref:DUF4279 domain-containing protein n=1 Tax=Pseudomarimonas arenosa TaxID=2774145 RepID=A0AAW3ZVV5_9GAMM|nr:DUF4279 domain-containing protein [Pseudomarimonas arenosa]MBD8528161.1 DUF4279 domain-containing protein [Pseudomarimonas arenosa]
MSDISFSISLRIWHPTDSASSVVNAIGREPRFAHSVGDDRQTRDGRPLSGKYRETYCSFVLREKVIGHFDDVIGELIEESSHLQDAFARVRAAGGRCELFVGLFVEGSFGFIVSASDQLRLGALGLDLAVDVHL